MSDNPQTGNLGPAGNFHLIAFRDGSYKKIDPISWKYSQWIHYTLPGGSIVMVNSANVNYIHRGLDE